MLFNKNHVPEPTVRVRPVCGGETVCTAMVCLNKSFQHTSLRLPGECGERTVASHRLRHAGVTHFAKARPTFPRFPRETSSAVYFPPVFSRFEAFFGTAMVQAARTQNPMNSRTRASQNFKTWSLLTLMRQYFTRAPRIHVPQSRF